MNNYFNDLFFDGFAVNLDELIVICWSIWKDICYLNLPLPYFMNIMFDIVWFSRFYRRIRLFWCHSRFLFMCGWVFQYWTRSGEHDAFSHSPESDGLCKRRVESWEYTHLAGCLPQWQDFSWKKAIVESLTANVHTPYKTRVWACLVWKSQTIIYICKYIYIYM